LAEGRGDRARGRRTRSSDQRSFRYALLVVATVLIVVGAVSTVSNLARRGRGRGLCVLGQLFLVALRIDEGHNVFVVDRPGGALEAGCRLAPSTSCWQSSMSATRRKALRYA
jgi:hypothetical protein